MSSEIIVNAEPFETRIALNENGVAAELYSEREGEQGIVGNIYKGRVTKVLPGMQAAFVDIGLEKAGFLHVNDVDTIESIENYRKFASEHFEEDEDLDFDQSTDEDEGNGYARPNGWGRRNWRGENPKSIEELLKDGQEVLVQISKEPLGTKGSRLTSYITLPGRYVVYMPTINQVGISRRIEDEAERKRLRKLVHQYRQPGAGYIVRTASEGMAVDDIEANMMFLHALWEGIFDNHNNTSAPALVHTNLTLIQRVVRDLFGSSIERMIIDSEIEYERCRDFLTAYYSHLVPKLHHYKRNEPIFDYYGVELEIERALGQRVWLKSGGYIVIDQTEALTTIDVNTGRFVGKRSPEETITQTNLEAVREVVAQLRLRDIGGIIIVDYIDMEREESREKIFNAFKEELSKDRSRTKISKISELGLVEMTRKRVRESLEHVLTDPCPYCEGRGRVKSAATVSYESLREVRRVCVHHQTSQKILVNVHPEVADRLLEEERPHVEELESHLNIQLVIKADPELHIEGFEVIAF
jgi:ribonuclease G